MPAPSVPLDAFLQPAMLFDADGRIVAANGAADALAGRPLAGLTLHESVRIFHHRSPDGAPLGPEDLPSAWILAGGDGDAVEVPLVITAADGRTLEIIRTASPVMDGDTVTGVLVVWRDVTGQRRAERALAESEERYCGVVQNMSAIILRTDPRGIVRFANDRALEFFGYSADELVGKNVVGTILTEAEVSGYDLRRTVDEIKKNPDRFRSHAHENMRRNGERVWVEWTNSGIYDAGGNLTEFLSVGIDATERKRAEEALRASEEKYRTLFESLEDGFCVIEVLFDDARKPVDYVFLEANPAFVQQTGLVNAIGKRMRDLNPAHEEHWFEIYGAIAATGKPRRFTAPAVLIDGWYEVYAFPVGEPGANRVAILFNDVTERKRAEETLRDSEARLVEAQRLARVGDWDWDFAADEVIWSRETNAIFGRDPDLPAPGFWEEQSRYYMPESWARLNEAVQAAVEAGEPYDLELEAVREDGDRRWLVARGEAVRDPAGTVTQLHGTVQEITERKRTEEALRESEEKYRTLFTAIDEGFSILEMTWDDGGRPMDIILLDANPAFERLTGIARSAMLGRSLAPFFSGLGPHHMEQAGVVIRAGTPARFEDYSPTAGKWFDVYLFSLQSGNRYGLIIEDITERRRADEARRESEARLRAVLEGSPDPIFLKDRDSRLLLANPATFAVIGRPAEACLGRTDEEFYDNPADGRAIMENDRRIMASGRTESVEETVSTPSGLRHYLSVKAPYRDAAGTVIGLIGTTRDITERKRAEDVLRETRDYLDNLINHANAPIIVWDPEFRITRFNAAFEHLSGYTADEVIGRDLAILFPEKNRGESLETIRHSITEQWQSVEIPIQHLDGGVRIALWNSANIYDPSGTTLVATIAQGQDITGRVEAEEALRSNAENLRRSNEDLERFAYVASHDLQEPLRSIVSFSQLLERRYRGRLGQDADEYIDFIVEGGNRMQTLILDLLAYSRVNTTRQQIARTDAEDVLAEAERSLDAQLREADATLTHDPLPVVMADPLQLAQVFSNLVSNAIKFRKPDEHLLIHVGARRLAGFWEFSVKDNGIGIEKEYYDKIFVIFQRLHTKDTYPGTGIGLAIVKRIVDRHGGRISVESVPGEGSTFFFTLPAA